MWTGDEIQSLVQIVLRYAALFPKQFLEKEKGSPNALLAKLFIQIFLDLEMHRPTLVDSGKGNYNF